MKRYLPLLTAATLTASSACATLQSQYARPLSNIEAACFVLGGDETERPRFLGNLSCEGNSFTESGFEITHYGCEDPRTGLERDFISLDFSDSQGRSLLVYQRDEGEELYTPRLLVGNGMNVPLRGEIGRGFLRTYDTTQEIIERLAGVRLREYEFLRSELIPEISKTVDELKGLIEEVQEHQRDGSSQPLPF